jgi:phosphonate transport system substrate-binding protein
MASGSIAWGLALALLGGSVAGGAPERPDVVISTLPFDDPGSQQAIFDILGKHLRRRLGRSVVFEAGDTYDHVIERLSRGEVDVGFVGAGAYIEARRTGDVRAILTTVRKRKPTYTGVVLVKKGSPITELRDLAGKRVAFVDRRSTAGYYYPRQLLEQAGIDVQTGLTAVFAGGHHRAAQMVASGEVDAGACFDGAQEGLGDPEAVATLARTEPIPGDPVVVRPGLGSELVNALRAALIQLSLVPEARTFFALAEIDGFVPARDGDYDAVAELARRFEAR